MIDLNESQIDALRPLTREIVAIIDSYLMESEKEELDCFDADTGKFDQDKFKTIVNHIGEQLSIY